MYWIEDQFYHLSNCLLVGLTINLSQKLFLEIICTSWWSCNKFQMSGKFKLVVTVDSYCLIQHFDKTSETYETVAYLWPILSKWDASVHSVKLRYSPKSLIRLTFFFNFKILTEKGPLICIQYAVKVSSQNSNHKWCIFGILWRSAISPSAWCKHALILSCNFNSLNSFELPYLKRTYLCIGLSDF